MRRCGRYEGVESVDVTIPYLEFMGFELMLIARCGYSVLNGA